METSVLCQSSSPVDASPTEGKSTQENKAPEDSTRRSRYFDTGATRDADQGKLDYEGFYSPLVMERYAEFMHKHRKQTDGKLRDADNWQKGIPLASYMKSGWRHFMDWFKEHRGIKTAEGLEEALCALIFNAQGYLHEILKKQRGL